MSGFSIAVDGLARLGERIAGQVRAAANEAVSETGAWLKDAARGVVGGALTPRSANLVGLKTNLADRYGGRVNYLHSRWFRAPRGGKTVGAGKASRLGANDVLAMHMRGGPIEPVNSEYLFLRKAGGRAARRLRVDFNSPDIDVIPFLDSNGNRAFRIVALDRQRATLAPGRRARRRGVNSISTTRLVRKGQIIGYLFKRVELEPQFDLRPVYAQGQRMLQSSFANGLAKRGLSA